MAIKKKAKMVSPEIPTNGAYKRIALNKLMLDSTNPRLAELGIPSTSSQYELLKALWDEMAVEEVAMSIAYSGYFEHEPLFVEDSGDGTYVVIEGNRRLAAVKLLVDSTLRHRVKATKLPAIDSTRAAELAELPVIVTTREESWRYLGFKHVNGPATWGSYAKAQYIGDMWRSLGAVMSDGSHVVVRIGSRKISPEFLKRGLTGCAQFSGRKVKLVGSQVTEIKRRQTDAFRPGTTGCVVELDCHFRFAD